MTNDSFYWAKSKQMLQFAFIVYCIINDIIIFCIFPFFFLFFLFSLTIHYYHLNFYHILMYVTNLIDFFALYETLSIIVIFIVYIIRPHISQKR